LKDKTQNLIFSNKIENSIPAQKMNFDIFHKARSQVTGILTAIAESTSHFLTIMYIIVVL